MDLIKIAIFVSVFVLLFVVGRILASLGRRADDPLQAPPTPGLLPVRPIEEGYAGDANRPALIGSEIDFPISVPPVELRPDGSYNRPEITNYFFLKTDLLEGPADHDCLFDELLIETHDLGSDQVLTYRYTVATLPGLRQAMQQGYLSSLYLDVLPVVIVERWNLKLILETVIGQMIADYTGEQNEAHKEAAEADRSHR